MLQPGRWRQVFAAIRCGRPEAAGGRNPRGNGSTGVRIQRNLSSHLDARDWSRTPSGVFGHLLIAIVAAASVMAAVSLAILTESRHSERAVMRERLDSVAIKLESAMHSRLHMVRGLAAFVRTHDEFSDEQFVRFATALEAGRPGVRSLQLAPNAVVTYLTHPEGNEKARGHDLLADPKRRDLVQAVIDSRQYLIAGPLNLVQGGVGLIGRLPIYLPDATAPSGDRFWGFSTILLDLEPLLAEAGIDETHAELAFSLRGKDGLGADGDVFFGAADAFVDQAVLASVSLPNGSWQITARVKPGAEIVPSPSMPLWGGAVLLSVLAGWLLFNLLQKPQALQVAAREAVAALQASERRVQGVAANLPGAVYQRVQSSGGQVSYPYLSQGFYDLFEVPVMNMSQQVAGASDLIEQRLDAASLQRWREATSRSAADGSRFDVELTLVLPSGTNRWVRSLAIAHRDGEAMVWDGIILDVTDRRFAEEQLRQSQKMEALGQLTGGMAHDFNNLLAIIVGNLELLQDAEGLSEPECVEQAMDAADRGAKLTRSLMAFARQQNLTTETVCLNDLVASTTAISKTVLSEAITLETDLQDDLFPISIDPHQLGSALLNLVINARDAMPNGGEVRIVTRNATDEGMVELLVSDTGVGMSPQVLEHAFEPFYTTKPIGQGSGLGLSMIYGLVQQSNGEIKLDSVPGEGTTVTIRLPRQSQAEVARGAVEVTPMASAGTGRGETVLVTEDDLGVCKVVVKQLSRLGYQVVESHDAATSLALLDSGKQVDVVLTDIVMPGGMSGFELGAEIGRRFAGLPVIYMSGNHSAANAPVENDSVVLSKPVHEVQLAAALRSVLDSAS